MTARQHQRNTTLSPQRMAIEAHLMQHLHEPQTAAMIVAATGVERRRAINILGNLTTDGHLRVIDKIDNRNAYVHKSSPLRLRTGNPCTVAAPRQVNLANGTYSGAELRPFTGRIGATQAAALPSLVNGRRVFPRGAA
jgi:hypothetical protein